MKGQGNTQEDCHAALCCLYEALFQFSRLMAPLAPFFAEFAYQQLRPLHPQYGDESVAADAPGAYAFVLVGMPAPAPAPLAPSLPSFWCSSSHPFTAGLVCLLLLPWSGWHRTFGLSALHPSS